MSLAFDPKPRIKATNQRIGGKVFAVYIVTPRDIEIAARHHIAAYDEERRLKRAADRCFDPSLPFLRQSTAWVRWTQVMQEVRTSGRALARVIGYRPHWWRVDDRLVRWSYALPRQNHIVVYSLEQPLSPVGGVPA